MNKLFSEKKIRPPEHCVKIERWQGPPHINKAKQYETVLLFKVSKKQFGHLVCRKKKKLKISQGTSFSSPPQNYVMLL